MAAFHRGILFQLSNEAYQQPEPLYNDVRISSGAGHHQVGQQHDQHGPHRRHHQVFIEHHHRQQQYHHASSESLIDWSITP